MGNQVCSFTQPHQFDNHIAAAHLDIAKSIFASQITNHQTEEVMDEFDNPSRNHMDHNFLKTSVTASNNKLVIEPKTQKSLQLITTQKIPTQQLELPPSIFRIQSSQLSLGKKNILQITKDQHNIEANKSQDETRFKNRQRKSSLQGRRFQQQQNKQQDSSQIEPIHTSQQILRQVSGFILSEKNMHTPKKITKEVFIKSRYGSICNEYSLVCKIGEGAYGNVYKAIHKQSNNPRAIKILKTSKIKSIEHQKVMGQVQILKKLDHPNIIKIYQIFYSKNSCCIVTQYCQGGSLLSFIKEGKKFTQEAIRIIFYKLMKALAYIHHKGIAHRDIKLDNIVLVKKYDQTDLQSLDIRLIDFGLAKVMVAKRMKDKQKIGTCTHMAPQVIDGIYSTKCDTWSAGIVLCYLSTGYNPFKGSTKEVTFQNIKNEKIRLSGNSWGKISNQLKDLLVKLLQKKLSSRLSSLQAVNHPWLKNKQKIEDHKYTIEGVAKKIYDYYSANNLVSIIQSYIAYTTISQEQIHQFSKVFLILDTNSNGVIQKKQLQNCFAKLDMAFQKSQIQYILQKVDQSHCGKITFSQLITLMFDRTKMFAKKSLQQAFNFLDSDHNGYIQKKELKEALNSSDQSEISCILNQLDSNQDFRISQSQFIKYIEDGKFN